jgi:hypothetical protein
LFATISIQSSSLFGGPSGWTLDNTASGLGITQETFYRIAAAGDPGSTATWSYTTPAASSGGITDISGVNTINPVDSKMSTRGPVSKNILAAGITTNGANELILVGFSITGTNTITLPRGLTSVYQVNPGIPRIQL